MKEKLQKAIIILIAIIINMILIGMLIVSIKSYVYKIQTGDIQIAEEQDETYKELDLSEMLKDYLYKLSISDNFKIIIIISICLVSIMGIIFMYFASKRKVRRKLKIKR